MSYDACWIASEQVKMKSWKIKWGRCELIESCQALRETLQETGLSTCKLGLGKATCFKNDFFANINVQSIFVSILEKPNKKGQHGLT